MTVSFFVLLLLAGYGAASVCYVYRWRGRSRYPSLSQYLRKSWPVFAPINCLLYMATRRAAQRPVLDAGYLQGIALLRDNWGVIQTEALALHRSGNLAATSVPTAAGYHDLGFRTFYRRGWKKFYLTWYGSAHASATRLCPQTVALLQQVPGIRGAMFSLLPAGSELSLHSDPLACSLRYHLGLATPGSEACYIRVDGQRVVWRNGEDFVFDETYPHDAVNGSHADRLILMCDVERPMILPGRLVNRLYSKIAGAMRVPNTDEDQQGAISWLFKTIAPLRERALLAKQGRRRAYKLLKHILNLAVVSLTLVLIYAMLISLESAGRAILSMA
ncbi:beta-hydroxylase [Xanthomonas arboricola]|uniref:aspartyl/asparaginyl beta-hydroxylase domain-containing protein n=1 Tax=Xanthomonas cannabis TaxID=1885674 RepID=UPI0015CAF388|nr:aspartyl/asparaginyl beta-hydroxylase domain-containing protein [Xanthomonas cannabis]MBB3802264.1 beta-hydroxylase [Xanthomonas cannabis]